MNNTFGDRLKQIRVGKGMSQDEFAFLLKTSKQVISRYENNQRIPKLTVAEDYAALLGVSVEYLVDNTGNSPIKKEPALTEEDRLSALDKEILTGFRQLPPAVQELVRKQIAAWKASE